MSKKSRVPSISSLLTAGFLFAAAVQMGCASFTSAREDNLQKVHPGQTEAQVEETLGSPKDKIERNGAQVWQYKIYSTDSRSRYPYSAYFENGKLTKIQMEQENYADFTDHKEKRPKGMKGYYSVSIQHGPNYNPSEPGPQDDWRGSAVYIEQHP